MAQQRTYPSLDRTGTQAAYYPPEETLWVTGPPINDPGDQGIQYPNLNGGPPPPGPPLNVQKEEDWIHEVLNGETSNGAYGEEWVNVQQYGPTGFGNWNDGMAVFQSGHSQNVVSNPAAEQGWGVGPARRWAHYPHEESPNPFRNEGQHLRNGQLPWVTADSSLYERTQLAWEQQWAQFKHRSPVAPVVPVPQSVPFVQTIPTYSGGDIPHPGVDVPIGDEGIYG